MQIYFHSLVASTPVVIMFTDFCFALFLFLLSLQSAPLFGVSVDFAARASFSTVAYCCMNFGVTLISFLHLHASQTVPKVLLSSSPELVCLCVCVFSFHFYSNLNKLNQLCSLSLGIGCEAGGRIILLQLAWFNLVRLVVLIFVSFRGKSLHSRYTG